MRFAVDAGHAILEVLREVGDGDVGVGSHAVLQALCRTQHADSAAGIGHEGVGDECVFSVEVDGRIRAVSLQHLHVLHAAFARHGEQVVLRHFKAVGDARVDGVLDAGALEERTVFGGTRLCADLKRIYDLLTGGF